MQENMPVKDTFSRRTLLQATVVAGVAAGLAAQFYAAALAAHPELAAEIGQAASTRSGDGCKRTFTSMAKKTLVICPLCDAR